MENKKIIFFDIDGTLVNHEGIIPESTKKALQLLKENGHMSLICTGRTKAMLPNNIKELEFDGYVMGAGTEIEYEGKTIHSAVISQDQLVKTMKKLEQLNCMYILEGPEYVYIKRETIDDKRAYFSQFIKSLGKVVRCIEDETEYVANKITGLFPSDMDVDINVLKEQFGKEFNVIVHENTEKESLTSGLMELVPLPYTKAYGIQVCIEKLGLSIQQTVAVGDSNNDLEMLEFADTSIVMGNGTINAKKLATFVTKAIDEDGIYYAMKEHQYI